MKSSHIFILIIASLAAISTFFLDNNKNQQPSGQIISLDLQREFQEWAFRYNKRYYTSSEKAFRIKIYLQNREKVQNHNQKANRKESKFYMQMNMFADMLQYEYKHLYGKLSMNHKNLQANLTSKCTGAILDSPNPPQSVNWTEKAVDKSVVTQGKCAANWAFSSMGAVEGLYALKMQKFVKFSDQQLIDCSGSYGNEGCGGGFMDQSYWYLIDEGIATEKSYPYNGTLQKCKYTQSQKVASIGKCAKVPTKSYQKLISAVVQQPVSVAVDSESFMLYQRGIFDSDCPSQIDRGMLLVGYGSEQQENYWILKNYFGVSWGEKGYIRLKRTNEDGAGMCGIQLAASVPQNIS